MPDDKAAAAWRAFDQAGPPEAQAAAYGRLFVLHVAAGLPHGPGPVGVAGWVTTLATPELGAAGAAALGARVAAAGARTPTPPPADRPDRAYQARLAQALREIQLPADLQAAAFDGNQPAAWRALETAAAAALAQAYADAGLPVPDPRLLYYDAVDLLRDLEVAWEPERTPPRHPAKLD